MIRDDVEHAIRCSVRIERMTATFCRRLDDAATYIQILLGCTVFADVANTKAVGAMIAIISVWVLVYKPANKSYIANQQQKKYEYICARMSGLADAELEAEWAEAGKDDSVEITFIVHAAENAEHRNANSAQPFELNFLQKWLLLIAGG